MSPQPTILGQASLQRAIADAYTVRFVARSARRLREAGPPRLADGSLGYFVRWPRTDDCFAAAIATVLQVPIEQVPDPRIDERLAAGETVEEIDRSATLGLARWLGRRGLRMVVHRKLPARRSRWIAVVPRPGPFNAHCLVMRGAELLFDPTGFSEHLDDAEQMDLVHAFRPEDAAIGLSFVPVKTKERP